MRKWNYLIMILRQIKYTIYVCDACQHKLNRCCNSEMEFTMMAEFYDHNPRAVGCVHTSWKSINFMWKWGLTDVTFKHPFKINYEHHWFVCGLAKCVEHWMYLRVAFDSFAVRFTFIFSECLFTCL